MTPLKLLFPYFFSTLYSGNLLNLIYESNNLILTTLDAIKGVFNVLNFILVKFAAIVRLCK